MRHNAIERVMRDYVHIKSSKNVIAFNTFVRSHSSNELSIRHGRENRIIGNDVTGAVIGVRDYNSVVFGTLAGTIRVFGGDIRFTYNELKGKIDGIAYSTQPAARNSRLAGNIAGIALGYHWEPEDCAQGDPQPAVNTSIFQNSESPKVVPDSCIVWHEGTMNVWQSPAPLEWGEIPRPVTLSPAAVGPAARLAN